MTFAAQGDQTRVAVRMRFDPAAPRDQVAEERGAVEEPHQTRGRLGAYLATA